MSTIDSVVCSPMVVEIEDTGVNIEVSRCPSNLSWSCPQDIANAVKEKRGIPAHCSREGCPGRTGFVPYEHWLAKAGEIQPVFAGDTLLWVRTIS